jgi:hypothetical protein
MSGGSPRLPEAMGHPMSSIPARNRLPNRRGQELIDFEDVNGFRFTAGIGRFADGSIAEIFLNSTGKAGAAIETIAKDSAVLASLALQHGADLEVIRRALMRDSTGRASGPLGQLLDLLAFDRSGEAP